jgi:hypothetical protein
MKFGTHICQVILFLKSSLAIAISAIFKMAAAKTKWRHFHTEWLHVLSIYCQYLSLFGRFVVYFCITKLCARYFNHPA